MSRHSILRDSGGIFLEVLMPTYKRCDMQEAIEAYIINPRYREVLRLRYCEGMTHEQIGEAVNYSTQHVKAICKRYKDMLISRL